MDHSGNSISPQSKRPKAQFGIGRLMVLTAAVAVVMTIAVRINAPKIAQGLLVGYLFFFALWAVIRAPSVYFGLVDVNKRRQELQRRRTDLEREMQEWKRFRGSKRNVLDENDGDLAD